MKLRCLLLIFCAFIFSACPISEKYTPEEQGTPAETEAENPDEDNASDESDNDNEDDNEDTSGEGQDDADATASDQLLNAEVSGVTIYEHHGDTDGDGVPVFNGDDEGEYARSAYSFVDHDYVSFLDASGFWTDPNQDEQDIKENTTLLCDQTGQFGFEASNASRYVAAPSHFDYDADYTVADLAMAFSAATVVAGVYPVAEDELYIVRLRNTSEYILMRIESVTYTLFNVCELTGWDGSDEDYGEISFTFGYRYLE